MEKREGPSRKYVTTTVERGENGHEETANLKIKVNQVEGKVVTHLRNSESVKKELDRLKQGLRDLPFEMVCAFQERWNGANSVVTYDKVTSEFNNSDRPGGADGSMDIQTGVFTTVTSGYYTITFSASAGVSPGEHTVMALYHNGVQVEESWYETINHVGGGGTWIYDQGSKTVVSALMIVLFAVHLIFKL